MFGRKKDIAKKSAQNRYSRMQIIIIKNFASIDCKM